MTEQPLPEGTRVRLAGWGLAGLVLIIGERAPAPDSRYYRLSLEQNGNALPDWWHRDLMEVVDGA